MAALTTAYGDEIAASVMAAKGFGATVARLQALGSLRYSDKKGAVKAHEALRQLIQNLILEYQ